VDARHQFPYSSLSETNIELIVTKSLKSIAGGKIFITPCALHHIVSIPLFKAIGIVIHSARLLVDEIEEW
jgi:hypothetical protein